MNNFIKKKILGRKSWKIASIFLIVLLIIIPPLNNSNKFNDLENFQQYESESYLESSNGNSNLFEGYSNAINITDYGYLYENNQEISLINQEELNLSYYLDDVHNWTVSKIQNTVNNIQDTRNWLNNSGFQPVQVFRNYQSFESTHPYANVRTAYLNEEYTIYEEDAIYMRVHFVNISFDYKTDASDSDFMYVYNGTWHEYFVASGYREDFYSPWVNGEYIYLSYAANNPDSDYGYYIDYYEFVNTSSNLSSNTDDWKFNYEQSGAWGSNIYGSGEIGGSDAMFVGYHGDYWDHESFTFYENTFSEIYQDNIIIPRGKVIDAYLSFDYYLQYGLEANNIYMYMEINNERVYSKGLLDLSIEGKNSWHHTGNVPMYLWNNQTEIFNTEYIKDQILNVSVGIKNGGASTTYGGYDDGNANVVWFDNITLAITTIANCSQNGINLTINTRNLLEENYWGKAILNLTDGWDTDPIILTFNTTSPSLTFNLNTTLFGYHKTVSNVDLQYTEGVSYGILENGSIYWEFYHHLYMPPEYEDFEFEIEKPLNWKFIEILDPFLQSISFEDGNYGDNSVKVNKTNALFSGWWKLKATSPNFLNKTNTKLLINNQWVQFASFHTGERTMIKTHVGYLSETPSNVALTEVNLTIYNSNGEIWYKCFSNPLPNGTVTFPEVEFGSLNTTGGKYNFTLFWTNGTALGGLESYFTVIHDCYITLLKPDDAKVDLMTGGSVGDIIPLRVYVRDLENNYTLSNAIVSYNWSSGTRYIAQAALGIYETVIDTGELGALGLYTIVIKANKTGYTISNITLNINLGEETSLQRLDSESHIVINANSTIRFYYYSDFDDEGISGALITVNISNPSYYTVHDQSGGYYEIEFSTVFTSTIGVYMLEFVFSAPGYEEQIHLYQFNIVNPPPDNNEPNILLLIILIAATAIIGVLGALSVRSYVILPRKRKKESELLARTQRFKDLSNIQAIVVINRISGIPIFSKSYSILEKHKKELFSGFIQAITTIGEEIVGKDLSYEEGDSKSKMQTKERILELDFRYFYCLIFDKEDLRIVFVLKEKASQRLKDQIMHLSLGLTLQLSEYIENWDGSLDQFENLVPPIINDYIELYYKEPFMINKPIQNAKLRKESELSTMETRILNVIYSIVKNKSAFHLDFIIESVHEHNKDKIIDALESLIQKKIIIPKTN